MKKIMIIDDDPDIVEAVSMVLEYAGYIVAKSNQWEVIRKTQHELPHMLLLDVRMSGKDGREICKILKTEQTTKHIPIIMLSASDVERSVKQAGADEFISKPFDMEYLLNTVSKHIK